MDLPWAWKDRLQRLGPWLLLLGSGALAVGLVAGQPAEERAFAAVEPVEVASLQTARVAAVHVATGDPVRQGQLLATLDGAELRAELAVLLARRDRELARESGATQDVQAEVEALQTELARTRTLADTAAAELEALEVERERQRTLVAQGVTSGDRLAELEIRAAALRQQHRGYRRSVALLESRIAQSGTSEGLADARGDVAIILQNIARLEQQLAALELTAPVDGVVSQVYAHAGSVLEGAQPLLALTPADAHEVVACLSEAAANTVSPGDVATLRPTGGGEPLTGRVRAVAPVVERYAPRCLTLTTLGEWGRTVFIDTEQPVVAGQRFRVRLAPGPPEAAPTPLRVPEDLSRRSRFEPSGLVWSASRARYLVVSDDTGRKGDQDGAPWLFAMGADGALDPAPVVVEGLEQLEDIEAIAQSDDGGYFLLASQSRSRKGKRSPARTALHRLDSQLRLVSTTSLLAALRALPPEALAGLGLDGLDALDIEGLAMHDGDLYLGLKAPLDAQGRALIWRLDQPEALLQRAELLPDQLSVFAAVHLQVGPARAPVAAGISDLMFVDGQELALTATPSVSEEEMGALYRLSLQPGAQPRRVRDFAAHKPEGLTASANAGYLAVVFDTGSAAPLWMELPWRR